MVKIEIVTLPDDSWGSGDGVVKIQIDLNSKKLCQTNNLIQAENRLKVTLILGFEKFNITH